MMVMLMMMLGSLMVMVIAVAIVFAIFRPLIMMISGVMRPVMMVFVADLVLLALLQVHPIVHLVALATTTTTNPTTTVAEQELLVHTFAHRDDWQRLHTDRQRGRAWRW
uniref:Putative secreted peptide n=1 Tax=Anopheles braziliensis TaxID=58242 RepID=A0A2M3ZSN3_9DIPT